MRILSERTNHDGEGNAGQDSASDRCADSAVHEYDVVPLHNLLPHSGRHQTRSQSHCRGPAGFGKGDRSMTASNGIPKRVEEVLPTHRRGFLRSAGLLVVSVVTGADALTTEADAQTSRATEGAGSYPDPDFRRLDSWIAIHENNTATFYVGKTDCGQGTGTSFRQMMSDELDIAYKDTACVMGTTDITVDQGGSGGSDAIQTDGWPMRRVAAEARRVLLEMG